jgi:spoIIIJ-associated protein
MSETGERSETGTAGEAASETEPAGPADSGAERTDDAEATDGVEDSNGVEADGDSADSSVGGSAGGSEDDRAEDEAGERAPSAAESGGTSLQDRLENEGDIAADYLEELLDIADLDGDLDMDVEGDRAAVSIVGADLSHLVGDRGEVLDALQELTRLAVYRDTGERSRLMLDISGHRAELRRQLEELAATTAARVKETGERVSLHPMSPFERKVVHDAVAAAGLVSESEGVEPRRYVVVLPA